MQEPVSERVTKLADDLADLPEDLRPFVLGVLHSRVAAHYEALHAYDYTRKEWHANSALPFTKSSQPI